MLVRQKPGSAKGVMFIVVEDKTGPANIVVWPSLFEKRRRVFLGASMMAIQCKIQREGDVVRPSARQPDDLSRYLSVLAGRDTEFRNPSGRGDEFAHGLHGGGDARDRPKPIPQAREIQISALHIDTLKVKSPSLNSRIQLRSCGHELFVPFLVIGPAVHLLLEVFAKLCGAQCFEPRKPEAMRARKVEPDGI